MPQSSTFRYINPDFKMTENRKEKILECIKKIKEILERSAYLKNSYFWTPGKSGKFDYLSMKCRIDETFLSLDISVEIDVSTSCRNVYVNKEVIINDRKTNMRAVNTVQKELIAVLANKNIFVFDKRHSDNLLTVLEMSAKNFKKIKVHSQISSSELIDQWEECGKLNFDRFLKLSHRMNISFNRSDFDRILADTSQIEKTICSKFRNKTHGTVA